MRGGLAMFDIRSSGNKRKVIDALYEHFQSTGKWPIARVFRQKIGRRLIEKVVTRDKQLFVIKFEEHGIEYYKLTFRGIFFCPQAGNDIELLCQYFNLIKQKFEENPQIQRMTSREVEQSLKLSKEQSNRLRYLIDIGHIWGHSGSLGGDRWEFGLPDDIEDLVEIGNPKEYLEGRFEKERKACKQHRFFSWLIKAYKWTTSGP